MFYHSIPIFSINEILSSVKYVYLPFFLAVLRFFNQVPKSTFL